jgi:teichuronic acid biosynthesis glycosyltransferase TuaH
MKNKVIVFSANTRFDSVIQATSLFLARSLAKHNTVFFIDYPFTLKDYFTHRGSAALQLRKEKFRFSSDGIIDTDLSEFKVIIIPPLLPTNSLPAGFFYKLARKINESIIGARVNKVLKKKEVKEFIYINSFNFLYPTVAKKIKPALTVYQCVDPMITSFDMRHGVASENILVKESDLVICTSKALYNEKKSQNPHTYFVPNAADTAYFSTALKEDLQVYEKIKDLPKPIIGYLGTIERRIDYSLITEVIKNNPDKTFVFAGPVWDEHAVPLKNISNLHMIGPVPYKDVPRLIKGFDIAIIPFKKDGVSNTIFPLKLFEYLSAGKPVILTNFNTDLKDYTNGAAWYCDNANEFNNAITEALHTCTAEKIAERIAIANQNTWENRADEIGNIVTANLNRKHSLV